jgi:uncharacterized protein YbjT (DUF2867 family)
MQNLLGGWDSIVENVVLRIPYSVESTFSFVDLEDIAEAAKIVLTEPGHRYATYELAGTLPMSHIEVTAIFSKLLNDNFQAEKEDLRDWRLRAEGRGLSAYTVDGLVRMFEYYDRCGLAGNPNVLRWVLNREPNTFEAFIRRALIDHETDH